MKNPEKSPFFEKIEDLTQMAGLIFKSRYPNSFHIGQFAVC